MKNYWIFVENDIQMANVLENAMFGDIFQAGLDIETVREDSKDRFAEVLASRKLQSVTKGALNFLLVSRYRLGKAIAEHAQQYDRVYVLFLNTTFTTVRYPERVLKAYKKKWPNVRYVLYYLDPIGRGVTTYANYLREKQVFDLVYTFDPYDAKKYDLIQWTTPYSGIAGRDSVAAQEDLYFIGVETERTEQICSVLEKGRQHGLRMKMDVIVMQQGDAYDAYSGSVQLHGKGDVIPYTEALRKAVQAKCILELVRPKQAGLTLRPFEAVVYNRKLLSNNKSILSFPFYNSAYMRYFETVEDIDWDWLREDTKVDYGYDGEFSPTRLLKDILVRLDDTE